MNFDTRLIRALRESPRASVTALASALGAPRTQVAERLRQWADSGAIRVIGAVNPGYRGLTLVAHVSISMRGPVSALEPLVLARDEVVFASAISGAHDLVMEVRVRDSEELHALLAVFNEQSAVHRLSTTVYSRVLRGAIAHGPFTPLVIDAVDRALIRQLQLDGRTGFQSLSDAIGLSPSALRARLQRLLDAHVLGIGVAESRGLRESGVSLGIGIHVDGPGVPEALLGADFADSLEFVAETIGEYDAIVTVSATTPGELHTRLERLRAVPGVRGVTTWTHLSTLKEDYAGHAR